MAKGTTYVCEQCGYAQVGWAGRCPNCNAWGSLVETITSPRSKSQKANSNRFGVVKPQKLIDIKSSNTSRTTTKISEFDRVLGGGFVPGQIVLLAGEPGIGKSTILLQVADKVAASSPVIYISGEESAIQVKLRADRLGTLNKNIFFLESTDIDSILDSIANLTTQPALIIIDSIQTMYTSDLSGSPGSVGQVRESAARILRFGKTHNVPIVLVGHVTKVGSVAGPATLAHMVDTVLWFEGDASLATRAIRATKNRFGSSDEVGIFEMSLNGLRAVDESTSFIESKKNVPGVAIASVLEGSRAIMVEIQSLVAASNMPNPRRVVQGLDARRVEIIIAVLSKRCNLAIRNCDVFVNVARGLYISDPSVDFAVAMSLASAVRDKPVQAGNVFIGEVGLLGEVRVVSRLDYLVKNSQKHGFKKVITSKTFANLRDALKLIN